MKSTKNDCNLTLLRYEFTNVATHGKLYVDDKYFCDTLEPPVNGKAIPIGVYPAIFVPTPAWSRFYNDKRYPFQIRIDVPKRKGILVHIGNTPADTSGCILVGNREGDSLRDSALVWRNLLHFLHFARKFYCTQFTFFVENK